jgi:predicted aspartyl protease
MSVKLELLIPLIVLGFVVSSTAATKTSSSPSSLLARYKFRSARLETQRDSGLSVRITINGKPGALLIATSAPISVLDRNSLYKFGLRERKTGIPLNGTLGKTDDYVGLAKVRSFEFLNIVLADFEAGTIDESSLNRSALHTTHLDGVFGYSQMRKLGAVIDCGHRNFYVNAWGPKPEASAQLARFLLERGYVRVPMRFSSVGHPEVDCRVNGLAIKASVETAAFTTIIDTRLAIKAGLSLSATNFTGEAVGRRKAPMSSGVATEFSVGNFQTSREKLCAADVTVNVLGIDYLSSNNAIIDSGSMTLFLHR